MPKFLIASDLHIDATFDTRRRFPEFETFSNWLVNEIRRLEIDYLLVLGDYFDPGRGGVELHWAAMLIRHALRWHAACRSGSVWISGNHDYVRHSVGSTSLSPLRECAPAGMVVVEHPALLRVGGVPLLCLPYPTGRPGWSEAADDAVAALASERPDVALAIGHLTLAGAAMGTESREMARGGDHLFPAAAVRAAAGHVIAFNGHYHRPQTVVIDGLEIAVPGSPMRFDAGERGNDCGVLFVEIPGDPVQDSTDNGDRDG